MRESHETTVILLEHIKYDTYNWCICGDLKVIGLLLGMQPCYTKYCCFICEWDSRARQSHYIQKNWPLRDELIPAKKSVSHHPLVDPKKVLLPPLHIKLGLIKNFVKAMVKYNKNGEGFQYIKSKFPKISDAKIKEGVFIGPQIRELIKDPFFEETLNTLEKAAWNVFKSVTQNFMGNHRSPDYEQTIETLLHTYNAMGCNMSLKLHFLHSHLYFFPESW